MTAREQLRIKQLNTLVELYGERLSEVEAQRDTNAKQRDELAAALRDCAALLAKADKVLSSPDVAAALVNAAIAGGIVPERGEQGDELRRELALKSARAALAKLTK